MSKTSPLERNWEASGRMLVKAAADVGIDPGITVKIAGFEPGFNSDTQPVASSAIASLNIRGEGERTSRAP